MSTLGPTPLTQLRRRHQRGSYDASVIHGILDEGLVAHVAFVLEGQPVVLPMTYARIDDCLYVHGAAGNGMMKALLSGGKACVTVTLLDGIVAARSAFHHSMNYRSAVVFGEPREVVDAAEKSRAFDALMEHIMPGRLAGGVRRPSAEESATTRLLAIPIAEASAKIRRGGPVDDEQDLALSVWAGVVPLRLEAGLPVSDEALRPGITVPASALNYRRGP